MGRYRRLGKNTLLVFTGSAGARLIGLLMLPFYTHWLSVEDYGTADLIGVYVSLLLGVVTACITEAVFIFPKGQPVEKQKSYFSSGLVFALAALALTAVLFEGVRSLLACNEISGSFTRHTWLIYGLLTTTFLQRYVQQFARSIDRMLVYGVTGIVFTGGTALFSFLLIPRWGVFGYVSAMILANLLATVYSFLFSKAFKYLSASAVRKTACMTMLKFSVPLIPNGVMWWLVSALNRPLIERHLGVDAVGLFAVANKFPGILAIIFSVFATSWQISAVEEFRRGGYADFFNQVFRWVFAGLMCCFFVLVLCSQIMVTAFTTEKYYEAWQYVPVLTLGVIFSCISGFAGSTFSATRESKYLFYSSIWGAVLSVAFNIILIPLFGTMGAAVSVPLSFAVMAVARIKYGWKYVKIQHLQRFMWMLLTGVSVIVVMLAVQAIWWKRFLTVFLLLIFLCLNYPLKKDMVKLYRKRKQNG
ncbi:MAG: polysaccharide biosynthesis C-terminal domain-containing protein [Bacteroidales bacterium]|jgi:O-antigen/teichoic acid export membrane protein|nr:polysaccharide biosynthesis C-terminal domain-containing protein [Bacteroidales bacterium]